MVARLNVVQGIWATESFSSSNLPYIVGQTFIQYITLSTIIIMHVVVVAWLEYVCDSAKIFARFVTNIYHAVVLLNRITGFARPSVRPSVRMFRTGSEFEKKTKLVLTFSVAGVTGMLIFSLKGQRWRSPEVKNLSKIKHNILRLSLWASAGTAWAALMQPCISCASFSSFAF